VPKRIVSNKQRILELSKSGMSSAKIAEMCQVSYVTVWRILKAAGVKTRRASKLSDVQIAKAPRLIQKHGYREAAKILGVSRQALYLRWPVAG